MQKAITCFLFPVDKNNVQPKSEAITILSKYWQDLLEL